MAALPPRVERVARWRVARLAADLAESFERLSRSFRRVAALTERVDGALVRVEAAEAATRCDELAARARELASEARAYLEPRHWETLEELASEFDRLFGVYAELWKAFRDAAKDVYFLERKGREAAREAGRFARRLREIRRRRS